MSRSRAPAAVALALLLACGGRPWDAASLARRYPALEAHPRHRLEDLIPYVLPDRGALYFFACRWSLDAPVPVGLPADASAAERAAVRSALAAWEAAGLGVRLPEAPAGQASIRLAFLDAAGRTRAGPAPGRAIADCRVERGAEGSGSARAELVKAEIQLPRRGADGRPLSPAALTEAVRHQLGHALGFHGHVRGDDPLAATTLAALYALPPGAVLHRTRVERWRTDLVDRMARLARQHGLEGPLLRVGETSARIWWRDRKGREYGLQVVDLPRLLRNPRELWILPEARTRAALPRSRDMRPD